MRRVRPCTVILLAAELSANYLQLIAESRARARARSRERRSVALGHHRSSPWMFIVYRVTTSVVNAVTNFVARRT